MKKLLLIIFTFLFSTHTAFAMQGGDISWKYVFHLQMKNNVLGLNPDQQFPYDSIPDQYTAVTDPSNSDYYGVIVSIKKKELARFGFNAPATIVVADGRSVFDVDAPFYADADHVTFYNSKGKIQFTVSTKDSSFCNDNNKCESSIGESYLNCPTDCPPPPEEITPTTTPAQETVAPPPPQQPIEGTTSGTITTLTQQFPQQTIWTKQNILVGLAALLMIVLAGAFWLIRRSVE